MDDLLETVQADQFLVEVSHANKLVRDHLFNSDNRKHFQPEHIFGTTDQYACNLSGVSLHSTVLLWSCGAVGGDEQLALHATAMIQVYHAWMLDHGDNLNRNEKRRRFPAIQTEFVPRAEADLKRKTPEISHYGTTRPLLYRDFQPSCMFSTLFELFTKRHLNPQLVIKLENAISDWLQPYLSEGQKLDALYSNTPIDALTTDMILYMLWKKAGTLYEFAGRAGASIGLSTDDHLYVDAIGLFCNMCGLAFELQSDIFDLVGNEQKTGKPFGSDIREGKRTLIALKAFELSDERTHRIIKSILGNPQATTGDIELVVDLFRSVGAISHVEQLARKYVCEALRALNLLPSSHYKELLGMWANHMITRSF